MSKSPNPVALTALAKRPDGVTADELVHITGATSSEVRSMCEQLMQDGKLQRRSIVYYVTDREPEVTVSPFARKILSDLRCAGLVGIEPAREKLSGLEAILKELARRGIAVEIGDGIFIASEAYGEIVGQLLEGLNPGERFSLDHAKRVTGLSRKYLIPLLERMEKQGFTKRQGSDRIVLLKGAERDD